MSDQISQYLEEFKKTVENYETTLTTKAENVSNQIKKIQEELSKLKVEPFTYFWEEDVEQWTLTLGLHWSGSKIMFIFDGEKENLLGSKRSIRASANKHLIPFLEEGLKTIKEKTIEFCA